MGFPVLTLLLPACRTGSRQDLARPQVGGQQGTLGLGQRQRQRPWSHVRSLGPGLGYPAGSSPVWIVDPRLDLNLPDTNFTRARTVAVGGKGGKGEKRTRTCSRTGYRVPANGGVRPASSLRWAEAWSDAAPNPGASRRQGEQLAKSYPTPAAEQL